MQMYTELEGWKKVELSFAIYARLPPTHKSWPIALIENVYRAGRHHDEDI